MADSAPFGVSEFRKTASLVVKLKKGSDPLSKYIYGIISDNAKSLIDEYNGSGPVSEALTEALVDELNKLVQNKSLYEDFQKHSVVKLEGRAQKLLEDKDDRLRFNRLLLEATYPSALCKERIPQEGIHVDKIIYTPSVKLGPRMSYAMWSDPRHLVWTASRYKFCAKMLQGKKNVIEVGCGDGFGAPIVAQSVDSLLCADIENILIEGNRERLSALRNVEFRTVDMIRESVTDQFFDGAYSIDVLEHLNPEDEDKFMENICKSLSDDAVLIIGTPNIDAEKYESEPGASPHINLKSYATLKELMDKYFKNSFVFSMNDEVVHTGFSPMAHFLFGMGVGLK